MFVETLPARAETAAKSYSIRPRSVAPQEGAAQAGLPGLFQGQAIETHEPGTALFWEADPANHVFYALEGVLRIFKILADGRRVITGFIYPGDIFGVQFKDRYLYTAEAINQVKVRRLPRNRFQDVVSQSADLRQQVMSQLCDEMAKAQDQMVLLARKSAEERVGTFLLSIARRAAGNAGPKVIEVPMSRSDIADYLGLTIETVSRLMSRLTRQGMIAAKDRHAVTVRSVDALAELAGEVERDEEASFGRSRRAVWPH